MRSQQREHTQQRLSAITLSLFAHRGYAGTTVRDIAAEAGVSVGLLFHYYASKEAMLQEHVEQIDQEITGACALLTASTTPIETFEMIAKFALASFADPTARQHFLLANQIMSFEPMPAKAKEVANASRTIEASLPLIVLGQQKGEIRSGDPLSLAVAFWGALQGVAEVLIWRPDATVPSHEYLISILKAS